MSTASNRPDGKSGAIGGKLQHAVGTIFSPKRAQTEGPAKGPSRDPSDAAEELVGGVPDTANTSKE